MNHRDGPTNLSPWQQNTIDGFLREETKALYLRGCGRNEPLAFRMACQWEHQIAGFIDMGVSMRGATGHESWAKELKQFVIDRLFYSVFPNN